VVILGEFQGLVPMRTNTSAGPQRAVCMVVSDELNDCSLSDCSKVGAAPARTKGIPDRNKVRSRDFKL
jgi:hypothetical protein